MGSTMLSEPRRKRKRTARAHASIRLSSSKGGGRRCCFGATAISLPCVAVLFGLGMTLIVGARKALKSSARDAEREGMWDTSAHPLAVLLMEQHEIDPQAALFADPVGRCLSSSLGNDEPPPERLGPFTCVADARFFLRALGEALRFPSVVVVDTDSSHGHPAAPSLRRGGHAMGATFSELGSEVLLKQIRIKAGEDPLPDTVDLVLIDTHEEALSADTWVDLIRPLVQVLSENGVIVVRGPREETASTTVNQEKKGLGGANGGWYGIADLWEAIVVEACDGEHGFAAAVGDLDGGIIVVRHAAAGETYLEMGCGNSNIGQQAELESNRAAAAGATAKLAPPHPMQFERLFLWATREHDDTTTAEAAGAVQAKFGGADAVRKYARRRTGRSACMSTVGGGGEAAAFVEPLLGEQGGGGGGVGGHLRAKKRHSHSYGGGAMPSSDLTSQQYFAARSCLESHLKEYTQDVRAGFALEMMLRAIGGKGADQKVARLRAKMSEESGPAGASLWRTLHARAGGAAAMGGFL